MADLEVGVEVGEADGGGVLERAVRLAPALQRRHCRRPVPPSPRARFAATSPPVWLGPWGLVWLREISAAGSRRGARTCQPLVRPFCFIEC